MAKKNSVVKLKRKYKLVSGLCFWSEFFVIALPFIFIAIINRDKYFIDYSGIKVGLAFFLILAVMFMAIWLTAKRKFAGSYGVLIIGWSTVTLIFFLLGTLIVDIAFIMLFGLIGLIGAFVLDKISKCYEEKSKDVNEAIKEAKKQKMIKDYQETDADCL